jgi:hypothetical protein
MNCSQVRFLVWVPIQVIKPHKKRNIMGAAIAGMIGMFIAGSGACGVTLYVCWNPRENQCDDKVKENKK